MMVTRRCKDEVQEANHQAQHDSAPPRVRAWPSPHSRIRWRLLEMAENNSLSVWCVAVVSAFSVSCSSTEANDTGANAGHINTTAGANTTSGGSSSQPETERAAGATSMSDDHGGHAHDEMAQAGTTQMSGMAQAGTTQMNGMAQAGRDPTNEHCTDGELADARDVLLSSKPARWTSTTGEIDLVLPQPVLDWMTERRWQPSHDAWHNVRRCMGGTPIPGATTNIICARPDLVAEHQECEDAEDGYEFLVMHRHMIQSLKQAFPSHADLFNGFAHFPEDASDVPEEWRGRWGNGWAQPIREMGELLEDIEQNLGLFATEGDLGRFIQCSSAGTAFSSIHGALHFKWVVNESPHSLGKQPVNIENYMFWKLHGWIDDVWERYRRAKGLDSDQDELRRALGDQCREMHVLGEFVASTPASSVGPLPEERGYFHEQVRPILEKTCSGCHGENGPQAAMSLTGKISSADIVKGLVNVKSMYGGQFLRVVPGSAEQSWLYLKASGLAATAGCQGSNCSNDVMPPTSGEVTLSDSELETIRQWIMDGAPAPTSL
ncbi:MAG: hypothetical protein ACM3ZE_11345 [Myxococcales bacterium]